MMGIEVTKIPVRRIRNIKAPTAEELAEKVFTGEIGLVDAILSDIDTGEDE